VNQEVLTRELTTNDLMKQMFNQLDLLVNKKITPVKANAVARLGMVIVAAADVEVQHHRLKPARGSVVRPVTLVREEIVSAPLLEDKSKNRKNGK
jgi:hypothetical protein